MGVHARCSAGRPRGAPAPSCMLAHGGASDDAPGNVRALEQIKRRGRWRAEASVRRYEKHA
eukprot:1138335-Pyramimonas_sp.AAC.1